MKPKSFDNYNPEIHPPWDSVMTTSEDRYRLIQQRPEQPIWDVSIPGQFLGRIEWFPKSGMFRVVNINRVPVTLSDDFYDWGDAVIDLDLQARLHP
jgi:hypothetical protein